MGRKVSVKIGDWIGRNGALRVAAIQPPRPGHRSPWALVDCSLCGAERKDMRLDNAKRSKGCGCLEKPNWDHLVAGAINSIPEQTRNEIAMERVMGHSIAHIIEHFGLYRIDEKKAATKGNRRKGKISSYLVTEITKRWSDALLSRFNDGLVQQIARCRSRNGDDFAKDTFGLVYTAELVVITKRAQEIWDQRRQRDNEDEFDEFFNQLTGDQLEAMATVGMASQYEPHTPALKAAERILLNEEQPVEFAQWGGPVEYMMNIPSHRQLLAA